MQHGVSRLHVACIAVSRSLVKTLLNCEQVDVSGGLVVCLRFWRPLLDVGAVQSVYYVSHGHVVALKVSVVCDGKVLGVYWVVSEVLAAECMLICLREFVPDARP